MKNQRLVLLAGMFLLISLLFFGCSEEDGTVDSSSENETTTEIVMFSGPNLTSGNLGGRSGADSLCSDAKPAELSCPNNIIAFISVDSDDELRDMEANYGLDPTIEIVAEDGTLVSENFNKVISGDTSVFEENAIIDNVIINDIYFPTGSNSDGSVTAQTCDGWTTNGAGTFFDDVDAMNQSMFPEGSGRCIDGEYAFDGGPQETLLCLCW